ncbi:MAG: zinc ribbon domain-containing protein [Bacillota bacterium]|nr:zinc ribbon domain-containing protein [Bacillota bacterium]MDW7684176.1 zinc ribbon domain-containing protein [Bacillota bacterium]
MPTYEFNCTKCDNRFEVRVPMAGKEQVRCPQCESQELREIFAANISKSRGTDSPCATDSCPSKRFGFG